MTMLSASSQTLLNDSTCCVPCKSLKKALIVKTERDYLKNQISVTRDSLRTQDTLIFMLDTLVKIKNNQISLLAQNQQNYKQIISYKDIEIQLYRKKYDNAVKMRKVGFGVGILGVIVGLMLAL
jgi:hypothetical protein